MSHRSHLNRLRRRRPAFEISMETGGTRATSAVWLPDPDDAPTLTTFGAAAGLAFACHELPVLRDALVLLDGDRRVVSMLLDPPDGITCHVGWLDGPGLEIPFEQTMMIQLVPEVREVAPPQADIDAFHHLRALHALQGLQLIDVLRVDEDRVQSLAVVLDRDCVWFDEPDVPVP